MCSIVGASFSFLLFRCRMITPRGPLRTYTHSAARSKWYELTDPLSSYRDKNYPLPPVRIDGRNLFLSSARWKDELFYSFVGLRSRCASCALYIIRWKRENTVIAQSLRARAALMTMIITYLVTISNDDNVAGGDAHSIAKRDTL